MKLSVWAKKQGISYATALRWFHKGAIKEKTLQSETGTILVLPEAVATPSILDTYVYARVSSATRKEDLASQAALCEQFCASKGWVVGKVVKEVASGMNDNRPRLNELLDKSGARIVVLHKDRITRFGFNFVKRVVESRGGEIVIINQAGDDHEDLLKDFISVITSFCCRLYGIRRGQAKALKMREGIETE